jgi:hypothetical protein
MNPSRRCHDVRRAKRKKMCHTRQVPNVDCKKTREESREEVSSYRPRARKTSSIVNRPHLVLSVHIRTSLDKHFCGQERATVVRREKQRCLTIIVHSVEVGPRIDQPRNNLGNDPRETTNKQTNRQTDIQINKDASAMKLCAKRFVRFE